MAASVRAVIRIDARLRPVPIRAATGLAVFALPFPGVLLVVAVIALPATPLVAAVDRGAWLGGDAFMRKRLEETNEAGGNDAKKAPPVSGMRPECS